MLFLTWLAYLRLLPVRPHDLGGGLLAQWACSISPAASCSQHRRRRGSGQCAVRGKRRVIDRGPHSIPLVALGTGLLCSDGNGFNAGSEFAVDSVTATAFLNTDVAASFAAVTG